MICFFGGSQQPIVDSAVIGDDGTFAFTNKQVIEGNCFYRLNVVKEGNGGGAINMVGTSQSFVFLLLHPSSEISFTSMLQHFCYAMQPVKMDATNLAIQHFFALMKPQSEQIDNLVAHGCNYQT